MMGIKGLTVIFSSHKGMEYDEMFKERIRSTCGLQEYKPLDIICIENNGEFSLTEAYNKGYDIFRDKKGCDDIILFCHNDIHFKTPKWGEKLLDVFNKNQNYGIIGLAGTIELANNGVWWNDRAKCFGIVDHTDGYKEWTTQFSYPIKGVKEVAAIDGVFMAVNPLKASMDFNEDFKNFHFYDISFCASNFIAGIKIGVTTDIRIMHESPGVTNQKWEENRLQFVEKYKHLLPMKAKS
jgi:glycosyltransferase involved in cell wall biosynthesis